MKRKFYGLKSPITRQFHTIHKLRTQSRPSSILNERDCSFWQYDIKERQVMGIYTRVLIHTFDRRII